MSGLRLCSGLSLSLFQMFVLSWWLWRFPDLGAFREKILPFSLGKRVLTHEREQRDLQRAWRLQLSFVIIWGWICALLFWTVGNWFVLQGGCASIGFLLLGDLFIAVLGWIVGGAWMIHRGYQEKESTE